MKRGFKKWAEEKSLELRSKLSLKYHDKLSAQDLAYFLGVVLINPLELYGLSDQDKYNLFQSDNSSWSAITIKNHSGEFIIIYNPTHSKRRNESNLMHEMAHIICEHEMERIMRTENFPWPLRDYNKSQEEEAEWLGGCLQLPRKGLVWGKSKGMNIENLADYFCASLDMVKYRLNITGIERQFSSTLQF